MSLKGHPPAPGPPSTNGFLLYDLTIDPSENVDLSQDPAHASVVDSWKEEEEEEITHRY
jgi:hypothetical protein